MLAIVAVDTAENELSKVVKNRGSRMRVAGAMSSDPQTLPESNPESHWISEQVEAERLRILIGSDKHLQIGGSERSYRAMKDHPHYFGKS